LVPGNYELSVQFFGSGTIGSTPLSEEKLKAFTINEPVAIQYSNPEPVYPGNGSSFSFAQLKNQINFKWSPVLPRPNEQVTYHIKVWQLLQGQSATQAVLANQPILEKEVKNLTQTTITNLVSTPCSPPLVCDFVWNVKATKNDGTAIGSSNGTGSIAEFAATVPVNTTTVGCGSTSTKTFAIGDSIELSDGFKMHFTIAPTGTNDSLIGKGTVFVKWMGLLNVQFNGIKINAQNKLCSGSIHTISDPNQQYPTQWAVNMVNGTAAGTWTTNLIKSVCASIKANKLAKPLVGATNQVSTMLTTSAANMPIGYFKTGEEGNAIGFTEMIFRPQFAEFEAIASLDTKDIFKKSSNTFNGTDAIAFKGTGIHFSNGGLKDITGAIKLVEPITFSYVNTGTENLKMTFNAADNQHLGNSIEFSPTNTDFWKYNLDLSVQLPKEWLIPVEPTKTNVAMNFQASISMWDDFILEGSIPACIIPNTNGMGIEAGSLTYDHSEINNAPGMQFPPGYMGNTNSMFTGFYLKDFKLSLPDQMRSYADATKKIQITAQHLIINEDGLTGKISANNVLNYPVANIGNLGASIDTVKVSFVNSSLTEAGVVGKSVCHLALPTKRVMPSIIRPSSMPEMLVWAPPINLKSNLP